MSHTAHRRFCRWRDKGRWEALLEQLITEPDYEWLMTDATYIKAHYDGSGARGGSQAMGRTKGGNIKDIWPWMFVPLRAIITAGTVANCTQADALIAGIEAEHLFVDKAYDSDAMVEKARSSGMKVVIPSRKNRKNPGKHDKYFHKHRHLVENAFFHLKRWRGIATRFAKNSASFLAAVYIRCIAPWTKIL